MGAWGDSWGINLVVVPGSGIGSVSIAIEQTAPTIELFSELAQMSIGQDSLFVVNFQTLKGETGAPGSDANVYAHEQIFDHGDLHEHTNKNVLDLLSVIDSEPAYNGTKISAMVLASSTIQDLESDAQEAVQTSILSVGHEYMFTHDYSFVTWLLTNHPTVYNQFDAVWTPAGEPQ